jgi:hypothetical protein
MNQFQLYYKYTWKHHRESPCVAILNNKKCFYKEGVTVPTGEIGISKRMEGMGKGVGW